MAGYVSDKGRREALDLPSYDTPLTGEAIYQSLQAFDANIRASGIKMKHFTALPCPVGRISKDDSLNKIHNDHSGCFNGHIYQFAGVVAMLFTGNGRHPRYEEGQTLAGSNVQATVPTTYDDSNVPVIVAPWDLFRFDEPPYSVPQWEMVDSHEGGRDRLKYPAVSVLRVMDNRGLSYTSADYRVDAETGELVWTGQHRPGIDPDTGKGRLNSVRYTYNPFYYCSGLNHEVRILPVVDPTTGERSMAQAPRTISLERETTFHSAEQDPESFAKTPIAKVRQSRPARNGSFGPK